MRSMICRGKPLNRYCWKTLTRSYLLKMAQLREKRTSGVEIEFSLVYYF